MSLRPVGTFFIIFSLLTWPGIFSTAGSCRAAEGIAKQEADVSDALLSQLISIAQREVEIFQKHTVRRPLYRPPSGSELGMVNPVRITLLEKGRFLAAANAASSTLAANTRLAAARACEKAKPAPEAKLTILVEVMLPEKPPAESNPLLVPQNIDAGREGLRLRTGNMEEVLYPSQTVISGVKVQNQFDNMLRKLNLTLSDLLNNKEEVKLTVFRTARAVAPPGAAAHMRLFRWGRLVGLNDVTRSNILEALKLTAKWYSNNQNEDGSFPYIYHPTQDRVSDSEGPLIRRLFGIAATGNLQHTLKDEELARQGQKALKVMLDKHYLDHPTQPWGYIREGKEVSLGNSAAALCAIARLNALPVHAREGERLVAFINAMRRPDGEYGTFLLPPGKQGSEDYYPGQAQLALLQWHALKPDSKTLAAVEKSYAFYRDRWRRERSLPSISWHTQANVLLYHITRKREIAEFVFEMNDLVLAIQQNGESLAQDEQGRFFNPENRAQGYSHVSSTGVYLEGLCDALALARFVGDEKRVERYRDAILRGLRRLLQMQISGSEDTWCMATPKRAMGGFRTRSDYPAIRIDNQQHSAIALCKALEVLTERDYGKPE